MQINNRAFFDNIIKNQTWLSNGIVKVKQLRSYLKGEWSKIIDDFERVAWDIASASHMPQLLEYMKYANIADSDWSILEEYRRRLPSGWVHSPDILDKVVKMLGIDPSTVDPDNIFDMYKNDKYRGRQDEAFKDLPKEILPVINRFVRMARETDTLKSFDYFLNKASDKQIFIAKYFAHDSYAGILDDMFKTTDVTKLKGSADAMIDKYIADNLIQLYPDATPAALKHMADVIMVRPLDKHLTDGKLAAFLRGSLAETRILSTISKFTLGWAGAVLMLWQNLFVNVIQHRGLKKGIPPEAYRHELVDYLINDEILKATDMYENHKVLMNGASAETLTEWLYRNTFDKWITWFIGKTTKEGSKAREVLESGQNVLKDVSLTGIHNAQDHAMIWPHLRAGVATAALEIFGDHFDEALVMIKNKTMPEDIMNRFIVRAQELWESGNNAFSFWVLRKHMLSNGYWSAFSYLQWYHMQRLGELTASVKKFADSFAGWEITDIESFKQHLWTQNPELRKVFGITFDAAHMGFYVDQFYDKEENNTMKDYTNLFHEYASSLQANVLSRMFTNLIGAYNEVEVYKDATGRDVPMLQWISLAALAFLDTIPSQMFREADVAKLIPRMMEAWKTSDPTLSVALRREALEQAFNGNFRYNMPTQENASGFIAVPEQDDIIGSLMLGTHTTNKSIMLADKMYEVWNIDKIIQGTNWDETKDSYVERWLKALPGIDVYLAGSKTANMEWRWYQALQVSDPVIKALYGRQDGVFQRYMEWVRESRDPDFYKKEVNEFFDDMIAFNYKDWTKEDTSNTLKEKFYGATKFDSEAKEALFTTLLENKLGKDVVDSIYKRANGIIEDAGFQKILLNAEAKSPGSGRVILSFLANEELKNWAKDNSTVRNASGYVDMKNINNDPNTTLQKEKILEKYYPYLYLYDKSAYLKVARNQIKNKHPEIYGDVTDSQKSFINTLSLTDFVMHREAISGTPSAGNIASVLSIGSKYLSDDLRVASLNYQADAIKALDTDQDTKDALMIGILVPNADMLNRVWKDPKFMEENRDNVVRATNILYGTTDMIANEGHWIHSLVDENMDDNKKKAYKYAYGSNYVQRPYNKSNYALGEKLVKAANKDGPTGLRSLYTPTNMSNNRPVSYQTASSPAAKYSVPRPPVLDEYFRISREWGFNAVVSPDLIKQTVRRSVLWDGVYKTPQATGYTRRTPVQKPVNKSLRTPKIIKRWPNVQLPLGNINIW